jgi:hypothetical protein
MNKPTYGEIKDFKDWLISCGYETDRDRNHFTKTDNGVELEFWMSACTNNTFKCLNARITLLFSETWFRHPNIFRSMAFTPCKTLSHDYVLMCEQQFRLTVLETASFFKKLSNLVHEKDKEIKEINKGARNAE